MIVSAIIASTVACGSETSSNTDKPRVILCARVNAVIVFTALKKPEIKKSSPKTVSYTHLTLPTKTTVLGGGVAG